MLNRLCVRINFRLLDLIFRERRQIFASLLLSLGALLLGACSSHPVKEPNATTEASPAAQTYPPKQQPNIWYRSARLGDLKTMTELVSTGRNGWDQQDPSGVSALMVAARFAQVDLIEELIKKKADINLADVDGQTAFHYLLVGVGKDEIKVMLAKRFIQAGANPFKKDRFGVAPIFLLIDNNVEDVVKMIPLSSKAHAGSCDLGKSAKGEASLSVIARRAENESLALFLEKEGCW